MHQRWFKILPLLCFIFASFTFAAIILINIGGLNPRNTPFKIITWNFTITPQGDLRQTTIASYKYDLYLNRFCYGTTPRIDDDLQGNNSNTRVTTTCPSIRLMELHDGTAMLAPNSLLAQVAPFRFDDLNMSAALAMYVIAAMACTVVLVCCGAAFVAGKGKGMGAYVAGTIAAVICWVFVLVGSVLVMRYGSRLRRQLLHDTLPSRTLPSDFIGAPVNSTTVWMVEINSVSVGSEVLGLTWGAVVAMFCSMSMWSQLWIGLEERKRGRKFEWNTWSHFLGGRDIGRGRNYEGKNNIGQQSAKLSGLFAMIGGAFR
ncbi:hypothetical protein BJ875DRAFT_37693 [Amylocarpus encephaloides]|uniref:Uncharacterized protein n=1 Tax=Amylocarpus encephaloides TaxID=45428 RepID=A0A9P8C4Y1_9HELO|nr:hypothetical protein BJ875DRAFT_37693 [Amylocarpus encephaloides]